jgi:formylglycine-generating enzyme required for sulfatase activity
VAQIFLCHASEDKAPVREVYQQLKALGFTPWLDEVDILPGQDWNYEIEQALETSDFVIVFLSTRSVQKVGYVQREFRRALRHLEEIPEGLIHTIPVKLDDCSVPRQFSRHQWVNLSENGAFDRIVRALHYGLQQRGEPLPEPITHDPSSAQPETAPSPILPVSEAAGQSVTEVPVHSPQEPEPPTSSQPEKPLVPAQKSRRLSVVTIVGLVIAAVSALAAVIVVIKAREWLRSDKLPAYKTSAPVSTPEILTSIGMELVRIPAGEFQMGSNDEPPVHRVRISEPFYLGKYEVTQAQWKAVMGTNPSFFTENPNRPVEKVSWDDVQEFMRRLNRREGWEVCRLPTEAQWEYAARAGTTTERYENNVDAIAWYDQNSGGQTHAVGQKRPNAWGVYDMLGNVEEWCHDGKRNYTADTVVDPMGPIDAGAVRVVRGGSWYDSSTGKVRAAYRSLDAPDLHDRRLGFRCASSGSRR